MAISYGTITITDTTDLGQLSVFLTGSTVNQQTCDINPNPDVYYPDWSSVALVVTPHAYYNDSEIQLSDTKLSISWSKIENGTSYNDPINDPTQPEAATGTRNQCLQRNTNLALNSSGVVYKATFTYQPIANDNNTVITAVATISFSITSYGQDGVAGDPGKSLQLIGDGTYFTYTWDDNLYGNSTIELVAQRDEISYICWECDGQTIYSGAHPSTTGSTKYTSTSLTLGGDSTTTEGATTVRISTLSTNWANYGYAQFQIFEADASGNKVTNGFTDYFTVYKYKEAAPGDSLYTSYLDNNEETITTYQGVMDLSGATTRLYINEGGSSDITNWHIGVADTIGNANQFNYVSWNSLDYPDGIFKGHSTTQISNNGTQNPTIDGTVIQTSSLLTNSLVSYYSNGTYNVFCWNGTKWVLINGNLQKYGPDCVAIITFEVNTAKINFTSQRGTYSGNSFTPDTDIAALHNSFSINKSASVIGHSLRLSAVNSKKASDSNTYTPPTIEVAAIERSNGGVEAYTQTGSLAVIIHPVSGNVVTRTNLTPPYTITLANEGAVSYIETFLGDGSTSGNGIEDKQTITISTDGVNGTSPWLFTIGNPYDSISTDYGYKVTSTETYSIPLSAAQGENSKTLYHKTSGTITYPNVVASCDNSTINGLLTYKYNGAAMTTSGANAYKVDEITFTVTADNTIIGSEGTITVTFYSDASNSVERLYTYKAIPAALKPITAQIYANPSAVFTNQTGESVAIPEITSGTTSLVGTAAINSYTWYVYVVGTGWKQLTNNTSAGTGEVHIDGVAVGNGVVGSWTNYTNGSANSQRIKVSGSAVSGYLGFKLVTNITTGGTTGKYTTYINFTDVDDPLQVTLHSTIGEQLVNGQGIGVIYARVLMGNTAIDEIPPDDKLGIGTTAPENAINTGDFAGKLGYCVLATNNLIDYYQRSSTSANWTKRTSTSASYEWYFRDSDNEPIVYMSNPGQDIPLNLNVLSQDDAQGRVVKTQQFVYLSKDVVDKKLTADVKVTKN